VLEEMRIRGLGVIEDAALELSSGLTVLTGETGAGKTIVVTGLGLLFGGRADSGLVRTGANRALVEGRVRLPHDGAARRRALDAGAELDQGELILSRTVGADARSRAHMGGRSVPVSLLAELAEDLVAMHGQHDQQRLLRPARQREALDRFAGGPVAQLLVRYRDRHNRLQAALAELSEISGRARERAQEADLLRLGLAEIEAAALQPDEDTSLAAEVQRLAHADTLRTAAASAHEALLGDPAAGTGVDALTLVAGARRALDQARHHDPELAELADRLAEISYLLADVAGDLASYADGVDADPLRLQAALERQSVLAGLTRKYGETVADVLAWSERAGIRLLALDHDEERIDALRAERDRLRAELGRVAGELSAAREAAARRFAEAVTAELSALAMPHARLVVDVRQSVLPPGAPDGLPVGDRLVAYGPDGADEVELLLVPHPGAPARPIGRGASGGELSRIMLAVQVVFAGADPVPTFVFDEVDAGVGGRAAVEVGRRLARLARTGQVLVVTHLPQVAAFADRHLKVDKADDGRVTRSGVVALEGEARVRELSRMLAGLEDSSLARAHAEELLEAAAAAKVDPKGDPTANPTRS
jgi:DNA repair protein RecN (Recombination protein N)